MKTKEPTEIRIEDECINEQTGTNMDKNSGQMNKLRKRNQDIRTETEWLKEQRSTRSKWINAQII